MSGDKNHEDDKMNHVIVFNIVIPTAKGAICASYFKKSHTIAVMSMQEVMEMKSNNTWIDNYSRNPQAM